MEHWAVMPGDSECARGVLRSKTKRLIKNISQSFLILNGLLVSYLTQKIY